MDKNPGSFSEVLLRGVRRKCPHCGNGKLFAGYLKQVESCAVCGEEFGDIEADDGPAWLTILIVGHILAPFFMMVPELTWPDWAVMTVIMVLTLSLAFAILPHAKGVFIGLIWRSKSIGSGK